MAIYSLHVKMVSRSAGRSVVAAAAYRAAEKIVDDRLGVVWDFTSKRGVLHSEIVAPAGAPEWVKDRVELWNAAERAEDSSTRRSSAATGRDIILALPHELTDEQRLDAVREYAQCLAARYRVAVDFAIHAPDRHSDERNQHGHLLMTTRRIDERGFGAKTRELDDYTKGPREIELMRQLWEHTGNRALEAAASGERIDCRSFADRGIDRDATVHLGPVAAGMERSGRQTELGDRNRTAQTRNAERDRLSRLEAALSAEIIDLSKERERRAELRELRAAIRTHSPPRVLETVTERRATFTRADLNRALSEVIGDGKERARLTDQILALPDVVGLRETVNGPIVRYTTKAVLAGEERVLSDTDALAGARRHGLDHTRRDALLAGLPRLNDEQRAAFRHATDAEGLAIIAGEAGTGKSTTLAAVRDAYEDAGYRVIGASWTNLVVQDMRSAGYRQANTLASELYRLEQGSTQWDERTVVIVDEAAMLSTHHLARVTSTARDAGAKLILAGDDKQLASIERGGLFATLKERHGAAELHDVVRVADADQSRAFNLMHRGEFLPALSIFSQQGAITWGGRQTEVFDKLVDQWSRDSAAEPDKTRFVFAYTNADVMALNGALRNARAGQGALGSDHILPAVDGPSAFAVGDRIQFTGTSRRHDEKQAGIVAGQAGVIRAIEDNHVTVALDGKGGEPGRLVSFTAGQDAPAGEFDKFRLGYAGTIYKGQGRTIETTYLYHTDHWRAASGYVALTRHSEKASLFVAAETARDLGQLARQMGRIDETRAASQFYAADDPPPGPKPSVLSERRHALAERVALRQKRRDDVADGGNEISASERELRAAREAVADARRYDEMARQRERGGRSR